MTCPPALYPQTYGNILVGPTADRPIGTLRYVGRQYFDTTIGGMVFWNGADWVPFGNAGGYVGSVVGATTQPQNTTALATALSGGSVNCPLILGRRYKLTSIVQIYSSQLDYVRSAINVNGTEVTHNEMLVSAVSVSVPLTVIKDWVCSLASGTYAVAMTYGRFFGTGTVGGRHDIAPPYLLVEDIGY